MQVRTAHKDDHASYVDVLRLAWRVAHVLLQNYEFTIFWFENYEFTILFLKIVNSQFWVVCKNSSCKSKMMNSQLWVPQNYEFTFLRF